MSSNNRINFDEPIPEMIERLMQEHNWVMNFLKKRLVMIERASTSSDLDEAKADLNDFVNNLSPLQRRRADSLSFDIKACKCRLSVFRPELVTIPNTVS
ncbi:MAG: hypothetical protein WBX01_06005 [Nitrososphaeraceae archaeon]|jgi:hypothetical protein